MAVTLPTVWYTNSAGWTAVTAWAALTAKTAGQMVRQLAAPTVGNERVFVCTIAGTTLAAEPTWQITKGVKTAEAAGPTWMEVTGQPAVNGDATNTPLSSANRSGAQVLGNIIKNNTSTHYFACTTAGTTGAGEPTYNTTAGVTTADNTCTWTCIGAVGGFALWNAPHARVLNALATNWMAVGDTCYLSSTHAETQAAAMTWSKGSIGNAPCSIICVAVAGSVPPVAADVTTGATVTTTGSNAMTINACLAITGIAFTVASGGFASFTMGTLGNGLLRFTNCSFTMGATNTISTFNIGGSGLGDNVELINSRFAAIANGNVFNFLGGYLTWRDTTSPAYTSSGTWPANILTFQRAGAVWLENIDVSTFAGSSLIGVGAAEGCGRVVFSRCKLPASVLIRQVANSSASPEVDIVNCDTAGATYRHERWWRAGNHITVTNPVVSGGASDGTTSYSWKSVLVSGLRWVEPFECMPISIWNAVTGTNVTVTIEGAYLGATIPNNDEVWLDVTYLGVASSTLGSRTTTGKANALTVATALTASTANWSGATSARLNTTAYVVGDAIAVSSTGSIVRTFVCTTSGTSAGSLPGGYATATDGDSITDNTAVFRCLMRFKIAAVLSTPQPQAAGYLTAVVRMVKSSATIWIDPKLALS